MNASLDKYSHLAALRPVRDMLRRPAALRAPEHDDSFARLIGAGVAKNHFGEHLAVRNWFSTPEFAEPSAQALELLSHTRDKCLSRRTRAALEDPGKWLFLDTETTGLAGGTGTYPFLVGIAWWDAGGLQVEQLFMRDFSEEHSLLQELAAHIAERPVLVTFNGKSFDWPLLENRFTMTRAIKAPPLAAHLDLLHPARALWKLRLGSVRLVELERGVMDAARLGWNRDEDIASALIPQYYFDYLRGGALAPLVGVVRHNQMDLRGLAALFSKINDMLAPDDAHGDSLDSLDLFGLSRFLKRRGEPERAHAACSQALDLGLPAEFRPRATRELAQLAKRRGEHDAAAELWQELAADPLDGVLACEQLAIHYERRKKDLLRAAEFAQLGLAKLRREKSRTRDPLAASRAERWAKQFAARISRLRSKANAGSAAAQTIHVSLQPAKPG
ncbi:MAG TPA: ribonuclease H-like domain-containing protein [Candidatus Methylomirabilis sp.]|nr:ribonuclease H-like domain-containing protein [Candidatus Methylomirabilis sp.]